MKSYSLVIVFLFTSICLFGQKVVDTTSVTEQKKNGLKILIRKSLDDENMKEKSAAFSATFAAGEPNIFQVDAAIGFDFSKDKTAFQGMPIVEWHRNTGIDKPQDALLLGSNFSLELNRKGRLEAIEDLKKFTSHKIQITPRYSRDGVEMLNAYELSVFWSPKRSVGVNLNQPIPTLVKDPDTNKPLKTKSGADSLIQSFPLESNFFQPNAEHQFGKTRNSDNRYVFSSFWSPQAGIEYQNRYQSKLETADALGVLAMVVLKLNWSLKLNDIKTQGVTRPIVEFTVDYQNRAFDIKNSTKTIKSGMKHFLSLGLDYIFFQNKSSKTSFGLSYTKGQDPTKFLADQDFFQLSFKAKIN